MKALGVTGMALIGAAVAAQAGMALAQAGPAGSLCHKPEAVLFSCRLEAETVSICDPRQEQGQSKAGADQAGAVYRYGQQGRIELELTDLHRAFEGWAGGGETQVYADSPTHRYIVYDRMETTGLDREGHNLSSMTQGLLVRSGGRTVMSTHCAQPIGAEPPAFDQRRLEALVPQGGFLEH